MFFCESAEGEGKSRRALVDRFLRLRPGRNSVVSEVGRAEKDYDSEEVAKTLKAMDRVLLAVSCKIAGRNSRVPNLV